MRTLRINIGRHARRLAFGALQAAKRSGFQQRVARIDKVLKDAENRSDFQADKFRDLAEAAKTAPHYRDISDPGELSSYPVLRKAALKEKPDTLLTDVGRRGGNLCVSTSGSYGTPMSVLLSPQKRQQQQAEVAYFGRWANFQIGMPFLYLRGARPKSTLRYRIQNGYYAYPGNLTHAWADEQIETLLRRRISTIISMPSAVDAIANRAIQRGLGADAFAIEGVICFGEALSEETRCRIMKAFDAPCLSRYSTEELGVIAAECSIGYTHHVNEAGYIVEILALDADVPARMGELGRVVVTDLFSHAMPLIRYDIGDLAVVGGRCACGIESITLERIEGRAVEMLQATDGSLINPFFINPIMKDEPNIERFQFAQVDAKEYELRIVGKFLDSGESRLALIREELGEDSIVEVVILEEIPPLDSGKRPYVVNEWKKII